MDRRSITTFFFIGLLTTGFVHSEQTTEKNEYRSICLTSQAKFEECLRLATKKGYNLDKQRWFALGISKGYVIPKELIPHTAPLSGKPTIEEKKKVTSSDLDRVFAYYKAILLDMWGKLDELSESDQVFFKTQLESLEAQVQHLSFPGGYTQPAISRLDQLIETLRAFLGVHEQKKELAMASLPAPTRQAKNETTFTTKTENSRKTIEQTLHKDPAEIESSSVFADDSSIPVAEDPKKTKTADQELGQEIPPFEPEKKHATPSMNSHQDGDDIPAE